jgi:delta 1-pyrroline-5-carboxylate dehydrogenase
VNGGFEPDADVGPVITPEAKKRCEQLIQAGIDQVRIASKDYAFMDYAS